MNWKYNITLDYGIYLTLNSTLGAFMLLVAVVTNLVMAFRTETWVLYATGILGALVSAVISDTKSCLTIILLRTLTITTCTQIG